MTKIAFLGLGRMGTPMAVNLAAAGFEVLGFDPGASMRSALEDHGVVIVDELQDLHDCRISISMLPNPQVTDSVLAGSGGAFDVFGAGHLHIHMGTSSPSAVRDLHEKARMREVRMIDAPVSGSVPTAARAALTTMVGASVVDFEEALPALVAMTRAQRLVGPVGDGSVIKLAINSVITALNQAVAEAIVLAEIGGVSPETLYDVLEDSVASAPYVAYKRESFLQPGSAPVIAAIAVIAKDIALAQQLAADHGRHLPMIDVAAATLADADSHGENGLDCAEIARAVRRLST